MFNITSADVRKYFSYILDKNSNNTGKVCIGKLPYVNVRFVSEKLNVNYIDIYLKHIVNKINTWGFHNNTAKISRLYKILTGEVEKNPPPDLLLKSIETYVKNIFKTDRDKFKHEYIKLCEKYRLELSCNCLCREPSYYLEYLTPEHIPEISKISS